MATGRPNEKIISSPDVIKVIDEALSEIKKNLSNAFAGGKDKPETSERHNNQELFEQLWNLLSLFPVAAAISLDEIDKYFKPLEENLDQYIAGWTLHPDILIDPKTKDILSTCIQLYRDIIRQRYLLQQFSDNEFALFQQGIESVSKTVDVVQLVLDNGDNQKIEQSLAAFDHIITYTMHQLQNKGYGGLELGVQKQLEHKHVDNNIFEDLCKVLEKLPSIRELNQIIAKHHGKKPQNDEGLENKDSQNKDAIVEYILIMEGVKKELGTLTSSFHEYETELNTLSRKDKIIAQQLQQIPKLFNYEKTYRNVLDILGYTNKNNTQESKGYTAIVNIGNILLLQAGQQKNDAKIWVETAKALNNKILSITQQLENFIFPYQQLLTKVSEIKVSEERIHKRTKHFQDNLKLYAQHIAKAKAALEQSCDKITHNQEELIRHTETTLDHFKQFFSRHWGKMTISTGGSGGAGGLLGYFALGIVNWPLAGFIGFLATMGFLTGSLVGMGTDKLSEKKEEKPAENPPETKLVQENTKSEETITPKPVDSIPSADSKLKQPPVAWKRLSITSEWNEPPKTSVAPPTPHRSDFERTLKK
ncbi:MAG: hypothetical protein ACD_46C00050G0001 [uncultured bacterium]|nr:MAG: hypothetical protein ACD_46C00050G0001 [uncultured bacterium]